MNEILEFLWSFVEVINTIIRFVINTFTSLITLIINIPTYLTFIINSINILPSFLIPFMLAFVSLVVVQYLLNRKAE